MSLGEIKPAKKHNFDEVKYWASISEEIRTSGIPLTPELKQQIRSAILLLHKEIAGKRNMTIADVEKIFCQLTSAHAIKDARQQ